MQNMYHREGRTDLQKMRDEAQRLAKGDKRNAPRKVIIHHHPYEVWEEGKMTDKKVECEGFHHETFEAVDELVQ